MYDHLIKVQVLGHYNAGKTSLTLRMANGTYSSAHIRNIGTDFAVADFKLRDQRIKFQIWDSEPSRSDDYTRNASYLRDGVILVCFDRTDQESYNELRNILQAIDRFNETRTIILVGTKNDDKNRIIVDSAKANEYARTLGVPCLYVSAKTGEGINELLKQMAISYLQNNNKINANENATAQEQRINNIDLHHIEEIFTRLKEHIECELNARNQRRTPWELGWAGSRSHIYYKQRDYVVPQTIHDIYENINHYFQERTQRVSDKELKVFGTNMLQQFSRTLEEKANSGNGVLNSFIAFFRMLLGIRRSEETIREYRTMHNIVASRRF